MFRYYGKRIFTSPVFAVCAVLQAAVMVIGCYVDLLAARHNVVSVLYCFVITNAIGISHVLIPVVAAVPFLFFYVEELEKKAVYYQLIRSSRRERLFGQLGAALLSAVAMTAAAVLLFTGVCLLFGAGWEANLSMKMYFENTYFEQMVLKNTVSVYLIHVLALLAYSAPWVLCGMIASLFSKNKYVILATPFIFFMALSYFTELLACFELNPGTTLLKGMALSFAGGGIYYNLLYHTVLILLLCGAYGIVSGRRFRHEGI